MSQTAPRTIKLNCPDAQAIEELGSGTVSPGDLLKRGGNGAFGNRTLLRHATAGESCEVLVATEDTYQGKTIDDDYTSGNRVFGVAPKKGERVLMNLAPAQGALAVDAKLMSTGNGTLSAVSAGNTPIVVLQQAAGNSATIQKVPVRVL